MKLLQAFVCLVILTSIPGQLAWGKIWTYQCLSDPYRTRNEVRVVSDQDFRVHLGPRFDLGGGSYIRGGAFSSLGREKSFFPVRTFDGHFGLGLERSFGPKDNFGLKAELMHRSAHLVDGHRQVKFRHSTYSLEYARLELTMKKSWYDVFLQLKVPWHKVPTVLGPSLGGGTNLHFPFLKRLWFFSFFLERDFTPGLHWPLRFSTRVGTKFLEDVLEVSFDAYMGHKIMGQLFREKERYFALSFTILP